MINTDYRVKVFLSKATYNALINDMNIFEFKNNSAINKGGFINKLFKNYHVEYDETIKNSLISFDKNVVNNLIINLKQYNINHDELVNFEKNINEKYLEYVKKTLNRNDNGLTELLSFKINKENQDDFADIYYNTFLPNDTIASYFRALFDSYSSKTQSLREIIMFKNNYEKIKKGIDEKRKLIVTINKASYLLSPYFLSTTLEENHNYLLGCLETKEIKSFRLCQIDSIVVTTDTYLIDHHIISKCNTIIENTAEYAINTDEIAVLKLSRDGASKYERIITNRPKAQKIENDVYYFNCSDEQLFAYFFSFGKDCKIISPIALRDKFKNEYLKAIEQYKKV